MAERSPRWPECVRPADGDRRDGLWRPHAFEPGTPATFSPGELPGDTPSAPRWTSVDIVPGSGGQADAARVSDGHGEDAREGHPSHRTRWSGRTAPDDRRKAAYVRAR